jgi:hypothetical protein
MKIFEFDTGKAYLIRLDYGADVVSQLESFLLQKKITAGFFNGIGAVKSAEIGYYDQIKREYIIKSIDESSEILSLTGNVSLKDGKPFPHIHIVLGYNGNLFGGHLFRAEVFACEVFVFPLDGETPVREFDEQTGLFLWK